MATEEQIREKIAYYQQQLNDLHPTVEGPHAVRSTDQTTVTETVDQVTIETHPTPPSAKTFPPGGKIAVNATLLRRKTGKQTPEEIVAAIGSLKSLITSGVDSAGYGDKRTEFRSLSDLRQILNGLEDDLADALGLTRGRVRQIRMTTQWDKGL